MSNTETKKYKGYANGHYVRVVAFVVLGLCVAAVIAFSFVLEPHEALAPTPQEVSTTSEMASIMTPAADPVRIWIPEVGIDASFESSVGLNPDGTIEVPDSFEEVAWYKYGPTPGEIGPAVVLGHVDSYQGPAVFWPLGQLREGDEIYIDQADGNTATFVVERIGRYPQSSFPTEEVYSDLEYAGLRVITCTGTYDHGTLRYSHNLVIFARLVEEETEE